MPLLGHMLCQFSSLIFNIWFIAMPITPPTYPIETEWIRSNCINFFKKKILGHKNICHVHKTASEIANEILNN